MGSEVELQDHRCASCEKPFKTLRGKNKYCSLLCQGLRMYNPGIFLTSTGSYAPVFVPAYDVSRVLNRRKHTAKYSAGAKEKRREARLQALGFPEEATVEQRAENIRRYRALKGRVPAVPSGAARR